MLTPFSKRGLLILVVLLLGALLYTAPARLLVSMIGLESKGVTVLGVSGYWHRGRCDVVQVQPRELAVRLTKVRWDFTMWRLLTGHAAGDVWADFAGKPIAAWASIDTGGQVEVSALKAYVDFDNVRPLLRQLIVPVNGAIELDDVDLTYDDNWFTSLQGSARLHNLNANLPLGRIDVGNVTLDLSKASDDARSAAVADIVDYSGQYGLQGRALLSNSFAVELNLSMAPDETVDPMIKQQMTSLFGPAVQGRHTLNYSDEN